VLKRVRSAQEDEWDGVTVHDGTQDEEVQWSVSVLPGRSVQTHQDFSGWEVDQDQGQEDLRGELLLMDGAFYAPFLGFGRTGSRGVGTEISVVDALCGDHREDEINDALEGVNTEERDAGFEMGGEFGSLSVGGFWCGHTTKTPPSAVPVEGQKGSAKLCRLERQKTGVGRY
jgi:hypothetical protein